MNKYFIFLITLILTLSGCSAISGFTDSMKDKIITKSVEVQKSPLNLPNPSPVIWKDFEIIVVTEENYKEVFETLKKDGRDVVIFGMHDKGYEAISINLAEMKRYIKEQKSIIIEYKKYYEPKTSDKIDNNKETTKE